MSLTSYQAAPPCNMGGKASVAGGTLSTGKSHAVAGSYGLRGIPIWFGNRLTVEDLLDVADLLLNLAVDLLILATSLEGGVVGGAASDFLDLAREIAGAAFDFVLGT